MFSDNFKRLRKNSGKTQKEIAEHLNISAQSVSKWETGESLPTIEYLPEIAEFMGCDINAFFGERAGANSERFSKTGEFKDKINDAFAHFKIEAEVVEIKDSVRITPYILKLAQGFGIKEVVRSFDNISYYIGEEKARLMTDGYDKNCFAIEVAKKEFSPFVLNEKDIGKLLIPLNYRLPLIVGKDANDNVVTADLTKLPHLILCGDSGCGKSVFIRSLIKTISVCCDKETAKIALFDFKVCEFSELKGHSHLYCDIIKKPKVAIEMLEKFVSELHSREQKLKDLGIRNLEEYNNKSKERLERIVIIIDELADLMLLENTSEEYIMELAMKGRPLGMHLVIATSIPSQNILTPVIRCNIPSRIVFQTSDGKEVKKLVPKAYATKLESKGDMLYYPVGAKEAVRIQGLFVE